MICKLYNKYNLIGEYKSLGVGAGVYGRNEKERKDRKMTIMRSHAKAMHDLPDYQHLIVLQMQTITCQLFQTKGGLHAWRSNI